MSTRVDAFSLAYELQHRFNNNRTSLGLVYDFSRALEFTLQRFLYICNAVVSVIGGLLDLVGKLGMRTMFVSRWFSIVQKRGLVRNCFAILYVFWVIHVHLQKSQSSSAVRVKLCVGKEAGVDSFQGEYFGATCR